MAEGGLQAAERADIIDRFAGDQRHAIPHHAAVRLGHQKRALSDRKSRLNGNAGDAEIVAPDELVLLRHLLPREPRLTFPVHELPLVLADQAGLRWISAFGKLGSTLFARP